ncbi:AAA family ATPase [Actinosynnema sp. NPDC059335]|uniref:AAA family ATPase n=1 Tax=Actinosynnema sp. NPDC059335 TaxID=3346804 RepID=UPI00366B007B
MVNSRAGSSVSPEATGGAGTIDEYRFAAVNLVKLLRGDTAPGLSASIVAVGLQRREAGNILDDVVLQAAPESNALRVEYQVKRTMTPVQSDPAFIDSLKQCLQSIEDNAEEIESGQLRLGLATSPSQHMDQLRRLTEVASQHLTLESFEAIVRPGVTDRKVCDRFERVVESVAVAQRSRGRLLETLDCRSLALTVLRSLYVWQFEIGQDGRDTIDAVGRLADVLPSGGQSALGVFTELAGIAQAVGPKAGLIDRAMVRAKLLGREVALTVEPRQRAALAKLAAATQRELDATAWTIADRLELPREKTVDRIKAAVQASSFVLVTGSAGVGKSVLARRVVKDLAATASTVIVNLTGRSRETLADLQAELGAELEPALRAAATTGARVLLIDGAEHALTDNARLLTAVLRAVPVDPEKAPPWTVIVTARTEAATAVSRRLPSPPARIDVGNADADEVGEIVNAFPQLTPLTRHPRSRRLLQLPYLVDLLVRVDSGLDDRPLGEEDVMDHVWEHVIRRGSGERSGAGTPHGRSVACLVLAEASLHMDGGSTLATCEGDAVSGLISDNVLVRHRNRHRFAHDILLDYAVANRLLEDDHRHLLTGVDEPRRLMRAIRLAIQRRLADAQAEGQAAIRQQWSEAVVLAQQLQEQDGPRWRSVPYEALLATSDPRALLDALRFTLLASDGEQLRRLLKVTRSFAATSVREPEADGFQLDVVLAAPVVDFVGNTGPALPQKATHLAADVVQRWLLAAWRAGIPIEVHIADPRRLAQAAAAWSEDDTYGPRLNAVLPALAMLGRHPTRETQSVFDRLSHRNGELSSIVEVSDVAAAAAQANPELLLLLAGRYYLDQDLRLDPAETPPAARRRRGRRRPRSAFSEELEDGVRDHTPSYLKAQDTGFAAPHYGPFEALLKTSPEHGLKLIGAVVDSATSARTAVERSFDDRPDPSMTLTIHRPEWTEPITYRGTAATWGWYRGTTNGAYPAMSALMALARWALQETQQRPLGDVLDQVLGASRSLAMPAVVMFLSLARLDVVTDELDPFLQQPLVWDYEGDPRLQHAAAVLVGRSGPERRTQLRALGDRLVELTRHELTAHLGQAPADDYPGMLVALKRARSLDIDAYRLERSSEREGMLEVSLDYPEELERGLKQNGLPFQLHLRVADITTQAVQARDEHGDADPVALWHDLMEVFRQLDELGNPRLGTIHPRHEAASTVASAVLLATADDGDAEDTQLIEDTVLTLLDAVEGSPAEDHDRHSEDRRTRWPMGADRAAATALPRVLANPRLRDRCAHLVDRVEAAILDLAESRPFEVRRRLADAIADVLAPSCDNTHDAQLHSLAVAVLKKIVLNAGLGPWSERQRQRVTLTEPLAEALGSGEDVLHVGEASDALPALIRAASLTCMHGQAMAEVLRALVDYDILGWPKHYARHLYSGIRHWRDELDRHVAAQILGGDSDLLDRYLDGFAPVGEELRGLLTELGKQATTPDHGALLLETYWPRILDRLLPANRDLSGNDHREHPHHSHEEDFDRTLLPKCPEDRGWPRQPLGAVLQRWTQAFAGKPHVADHAITCLAQYRLLGSPTATGMILDVLGDNTRIIRQDCQTVTAWLYVILIVNKDASVGHKPRLLRLLDELADAGDTDAIELQRELELQ